MQKYKKVMVFGVFDGLHEGHLYFLNEAKKLCDALIVVVASDIDVGMYKKKSPKYLLKERIKALKLTGIPNTVVEGDNEPDSWWVIKKYAPDIVAVGHDQEAIAESLKKCCSNIKIARIDFIPTP
jgi:cytidyltransferase-like protein